MVIEGAATLLERDDELDAFGNALTEGRLGGGQVVVVEASAGLGKTSLLKAASKIASEGRLHVPSGTGNRVGARLRVRLRSAIAGTRDQRVSRSPSLTVSSPARQACRKRCSVPTGIELSSSFADRSLSMLHGLYWLLNNLADVGPVALSVDDLHLVRRGVAAVPQLPHASPGRPLRGRPRVDE